MQWGINLLRLIAVNAGHVPGTREYTAKLRTAILIANGFYFLVKAQDLRTAAMNNKRIAPPWLDYPRYASQGHQIEVMDRMITM